MTTSLLGRKLIEQFEGFSPSAYQDQRGIPTIAYGHTSGVKMGDSCTLWEADEWLAQDLKTAEDAIAKMVTCGLTQNQYDALISLVFNIGQGNFSRSTVLRELNILQYRAAADAFLMWCRTNGNVNAGLQRRREAERALFLTAPSTENFLGGSVSNA
jgi:lysozyme